MLLAGRTNYQAFQPIITLGASAEPVDMGRLEQALREANIPTLVAVLAHLSDAERWLQPPYTPTRTKGMSDHASGGLTESAQDQVRAAVLAEVRRWHAAGRPAVRELDDTELARIMTVCMGEQVPSRYSGMMAEEMGLRPRFDNQRVARLSARTKHSAVIVGAGASGICMAVQLKQAGIPFTVIEKNPDVGGTWWENRYPDCRVDTPSYWYSFSFRPHTWTRYYSERPDLHAYLRTLVDEYELRENILFDTKVDVAEYNSDSNTWHITASGPDNVAIELGSTFLITAVGQLNQPKMPPIPGRETFAHPQFHSARWPANIDLEGKRVAVIGTGASAMQLVPAIAERVRHLTVFQRSPQWIAPNTEYKRELPSGVHYLMAHVPYYAAWYRMRQVWVFGDKIHHNLRMDPEWHDPRTAVNSVNAGYRRYFEAYLHDQLADRPDLIEKAIPDYPPFGKRMLLDNGWFRTLRMPHVELETTAITSIGPDAVHTADGAEHRADIIIYATGFDTLNLLGSLDIRGRDGVSVRDRWGADDPRAYLGITERGFPNLFMLYGPNTNLGHGGSLLFITEGQVRYIMSLIAQMTENGVASVECRQDVRDEYNAELDAAHAKLLWTHPAVRTWYRNDKGRVVTNSPWQLIDLWERSLAPNLDDYEVTVAAPPTITTMPS